jgi:15-cis-phytoene synthase
MQGLELYNSVCFDISRSVTKSYSTSFTLGIRTLHKRFQFPIYAVYGFVRYADEIVDTFHHHNQKELLENFKKETFAAIQNKISTNPILQSFQLIVNKYKIDQELIAAFLHSMEMDLSKQTHERTSYNEYIYGSAEVVGLMCLTIFVEGDKEEYKRLKEGARSLGAAFQKVNFLRDMKSDFDERGRVYFPKVDFNRFDSLSKEEIENEIEDDFKKAYEGILGLPKDARFGVYVAYRYYKRLLHRIKITPASKIVNERIRVPANEKASLLFRSYCRFRLNMM